MIRTCGLSCNAASSTPRTVTLLMPSDPILCRFMMTTTSLELMGCPSGDRATCGRLVTIPAASRSMMLMISLVAAFRTTVTLSSKPVDLKACKAKSLEYRVLVGSFAHRHDHGVAQYQENYPDDYRRHDIHRCDDCAGSR